MNEIRASSSLCKFSSPITRMRRSSGFSPGEIDNPPLICRMPAKGGIWLAATDEPRNQQCKGGFAVARLRCQRVDEAALQDAIEQIIRRNKSREKICYGYDQVFRPASESAATFRSGLDLSGGKISASLDAVVWSILVFLSPWRLPISENVPQGALDVIRL